MIEDDVIQLSKYLPKEAVSEILTILKDNNVALTITNARKTKFGDYKWPGKKYGYHRISVNGSLNKYAFLTTLLHELAHMFTWSSYKNEVKVHGMEWKHSFSTILLAFSKKEYLPKDIRIAFARHAQKPKATSMSDLEFFQVLSNYDEKENSTTVHLKSLRVGNSFFHNDKRFKILAFRRTRILCENIDSKRKYLVHSLAEVSPF